MKIITVPHPTLRAKAQPVKKVDKKLLNFIGQLKSTLKNTSNPKGVGLAAPQVDKEWRIFATWLSKEETNQPGLQIFINPVITKHSTQQILGISKNDKETRDEGCLSIPNLYGPVPRWEWIEAEFDQVIDNQLKRTKQKISNFAARVFQHELDHLDGILFTDHSLKFDLPVYQKVGINKFEEIDQRILESF